MEIKLQNNMNNGMPFIPKRLAAAFVVPQVGGDTFEPMEGLRRGTIYPELYMPYVTRRQRNGKK